MKHKHYSKKLYNTGHTFLIQNYMIWFLPWPGSCVVQHDLMDVSKTSMIIMCQVMCCCLCWC